jgi:AraC-like DNA-binding protein
MHKPLSEIDVDSRRLRLVNATAGAVVHPAGTRIGPRRQEQIQMLLIHAGEMTVAIDDQPVYSLSAGHMCLLLPGHVERIWFVGQPETRQTLVRGDPEQLTASMRAWLETIRPTRPLSAALTYLAREAVVSEQTRLTAHGALIDALGTALLWRFIAEFQNLPAALPRAIEDARLFIHRNLDRDIRLDDIAHASHVTPAHLVRLFGAHMGTTPMRYLWDRRVTQGVELLTSSGLSMTAIAARCGFKTSFHFARKVKEATGMSPTTLRAANWNIDAAGGSDRDTPRLLPSPGS